MSAFATFFNGQLLTVSQGFMAQLTTWPHDGVGIVVITNDSPRGYFMHNSATWRAAEDLLGMPKRVDWVSRYELSHTSQ